MKIPTLHLPSKKRHAAHMPRHAGAKRMRRLAHAKHLAAVLSSVALLSAAALPSAYAATSAAQAASETSYDITISDSTINYVYQAYKILDARYDDSGNVAYTIAEDSPWLALVRESGLFTLYRIGSTERYSVLADAADSEIIAWLQSLAGTGESAEVPAGVESAGSVEGNGEHVDLEVGEPGYYYVTSSLGALVTLTSAVPHTTVIDKNESPGFREGEGKKVCNAEGDYVDATDMTIGATAAFRITASVPLYDHQQAVTRYTLTDELPEGLTIEATRAADIAVSFEDDGEMLAEGDISYTVSLLYAEGNPAPIAGFTVTIDVAASEHYPVNNDTLVIVDYQATLNTAAAHENVNTASLAWTRADGSPGAGDEDAADVYTYGFSLVKRAGSASGPQLEGAEFKLYTSPDATEAIWLSEGEDGLYTVVSADGEPANTARLTQTVTAGSAQVFGLQEGTYYLEENRAPDGYNPLAERAEVVLSAENSDADGYAATADVVNSAGALLPSTGGIGTVILDAAGCGLLAAAAVAWRRAGAKRRSAASF